MELSNRAFFGVGGCMHTLDTDVLEEMASHSHD